MGIAKGTITRRMETAFNGLLKEFKMLCNRTDVDNKLEALRKASKSARPSKLRDLLELFDLCGIAYERGKDLAYYEKLVREADIPTFSELEYNMLRALYTHFREYPSPEEYMRRIVDRLSSEEDGWSADTLRVRILKQFIKYGNCLTYQREVVGEDGAVKQEKVMLYGGEPYIKKYLKAKTGHAVKEIGEHLGEIGDDLFDVLADASKEQKKPSGPYGVLKIVDDLATGKFRTGGGTKKSLYLFAMVYGMTYYSGGAESGLALDYSTDIEKNLFTDYYANNLMRFLSEVYQQQKLCEFEIDPSGQGINYKNFAEMIYLYYITKDISPCEKIRLSAEMIERIPEIQKEYLAEGETRPKKKAEGTAFYRNAIRNSGGGNLFSEDILSLPEEEFVAFICRNYNCDTTSGKSAIGAMQLEPEQITAYRTYEKILTMLIVALKKQEGEKVAKDYDFAKLTDEEKAEERSEWLTKCNYGLWFTDPGAFKKEGYEHKRKALYDKIYVMLPAEEKLKFTKDAVDEFINLLFAINSFMGHSPDEKVSLQNEAQERTDTSRAKTKALFVSSESEVTRTSLIVAYYYYYNIVHEDDGREIWKSFDELFTSFSYEINEFLEAAHYQPLSGRNLFDILVVFSSYAYMHDIMF